MAAPLIAASFGLQALGQYQSGQAASKAYAYQAAVAQNNAKISEQNAVYSTLAGESQAQEAGLKAGQEQGALRAGIAANGVDVNSGSAVDVQAGQRLGGALTQENIMQNALLRAYGYRTQATSFQAQSKLDTASSEEAPIAAAFGAAGSLLKGGSQLFGGSGSGSGTSTSSNSADPWTIG